MGPARTPTVPGLVPKHRVVPQSNPHERDTPIDKFHYMQTPWACSKILAAFRSVQRAEAHSGKQYRALL